MVLWCERFSVIGAGNGVAGERRPHRGPGGVAPRRPGALEVMAVQLDEAKAFLTRGTVSHSRLAFILLDNAAEVIMRRNVEVRLTHNATMERVLRKWKEILQQHPGDAEARRHHDEVEQEVVPRAARRELARLFDAKATSSATGEISRRRSLGSSRSCTGT